MPKLVGLFDNPLGFLLCRVAEIEQTPNASIQQPTTVLDVLDTGEYFRCGRVAVILVANVMLDFVEGMVGDRDDLDLDDRAAEGCSLERRVDLYEHVTGSVHVALDLECTGEVGDGEGPLDEVEGHGFVPGVVNDDPCPCEVGYGSVERCAEVLERGSGVVTVPKTLQLVADVVRMLCARGVDGLDRFGSQGSLQTALDERRGVFISRHGLAIAGYQSFDLAIGESLGHAVERGRARLAETRSQK